MIQRKQTLFLLELVFLGIALLFIPSNVIIKPDTSLNVYLLMPDGSYNSTPWHFIAIAINFACLIVSVITIFMFKKRTLQVKLCYAMITAWLFMAVIMAFFPLAHPDGNEIQNSYVGLFISLFAILAAYLAARFINKDIELLKSADRIR